MKVNILLSAYNGEKYLREQVESIQKQSFTDWTLLIRDDGSSDSTPDIIRSCAAQDERIHFINDGHIKNVGVIRSFFELLTYEEADYYLFCDQDDYWLTDKVRTQVEEALKYPEHIPHMNYMDPVVVDSQLRTLSPSMIRSQSGHANTQLVQELTENSVTGGVSLINHALAQKWKSVTDDIIMHDWFLAVCASATGTLVFIDKPGELYRQHEANVLGARTLSKKLATFSHPIALVRKNWWLITSSQRQAEQILEQERENLSGDAQELMEAYIHILDQPFFTRIRQLKHYKLRKNKLLTSLFFWLLIVTRWGYRRK
ncbi:glycosyltransferase family 2 protein [Alloscardovia omnicolens]|uniref:glycosyltransferase family 2 protein n=1 Tax=Alloscardovia omnicolens TaxID=419015 RepID=UPI003A645C1E